MNSLPKQILYKMQNKVQFGKAPYSFSFQCTGLWKIQANNFTHC